MSYKALLVFVIGLFLSACVSNNTTKIEAQTKIADSDSSPAAIIEMSKDATIAFVSQSLRKDEHFYPQCSGFWIDKDTIMTAAHCAQGAAHMEKVRKFPLKDRDEADHKIPKVKNPTGFMMTYIVEDEVTGINTVPTRTHKAKVVAIDEKRDMALLKAEANNMPRHGWFHLAQQLPRVGDKVYVVGHQSDLYFTAMDGMLAAVRPNYPFDPNDDFNVAGPVIQVYSSIYKGNSGGPVISEKGEVIGVVSFITHVPNQGFAVALPSMRQFITDSRTKKLL